MLNVNKQFVGALGLGTDQPSFTGKRLLKSDGEFLPARHYARAGISVSVHPSICPSVTCRYCTKVARLKITQTTLSDSPRTLVFWRQLSLVDDPSIPLKFVFEVTHPPFQTQQFRLVSTHSASTVRASENPVSTYRNSTTRFPTSHRRTVYVAPKSLWVIWKRETQNAILLFCQ